jgi:hypothetical protein
MTVRRCEDQLHALQIFFVQDALHKNQNILLGSVVKLIWIKDNMEPGDDEATYYGGKTPMSKKAAEHHKKASEHHTHAARHHGEAAKHYEAGQHEKAAHHAHTARAHAIHARGHAEEAVKAHHEEHGNK